MKLKLGRRGTSSVIGGLIITFVFIYIMYSFILIELKRQEYYGALKLKEAEEEARLLESLDVSFMELNGKILVYVENKATLPVGLAYLITSYGGGRMELIRLDVILEPNAKLTLGPYLKFMGDSQPTVKIVTKRGNIFQAHAISWT